MREETALPEADKRPKVQRGLKEDQQCGERAQASTIVTKKFCADQGRKGEVLFGCWPFPRGSCVIQKHKIIPRKMRNPCWVVLSIHGPKMCKQSPIGEIKHMGVGGDEKLNAQGET